MLLSERRSHHSKVDVDRNYISSSESSQRLTQIDNYYKVTAVELAKCLKTTSGKLIAMATHHEKEKNLLAIHKEVRNYNIETKYTNI